jgi:hypothetical protein
MARKGSWRSKSSTPMTSGKSSNFAILSRCPLRRGHLAGAILDEFVL